MKLPTFHGDPYAYQDTVVFTFRQQGLDVAYHCEKLPGARCRIRTAVALRIRSKCIDGEWKLNRAGTHWTLYSLIPRNIIHSIPAHEVYWAYGFGSMFGCADFETYGSGAITRWRIVTRKQQCNHCEQMFEANLNEYKIQCSTCKDRFREIRGNLSPEERDVWLRPYKVARREQRDLAQNSRWVREFAAKGSFTRAQFKELCAAYGKVCLCCRGKGPLVPDHVIPLESQGSNDITNIQPLCKRCNSRKGTKDTDYRLKHRRR